MTKEKEFWQRLGKLFLATLLISLILSLFNFAGLLNPEIKIVQAQESYPPPSI